MSLRKGIEHLSGLDMGDVRVHYNSSQPAKLNALAHTQGNDIHLARGQEPSLPHEMWHVVQQRQGRVNQTRMLNQATPLNENETLEREADRMGSVAARLNHHLLEPRSLSRGGALSRVVQRKKVGTGFGEFETTSFGEASDARGKGVDIELTFDPEKKKVTAEKIGLVQSIKTTTASGNPIFLGMSKKPRMPAAGKSGAGYAIDAPVTSNNPIYYNTGNLSATQDLKDTPMSPPSVNPQDPTQALTNANYQLGFCKKENPKDKDKDKKTQVAKLVDKPRTHKAGQSQYFETAALVIDGADKGKYLGSVKWGYKLEDDAGTIKIKPDDISLASPAKGKSVGTPTENFVEAAKLWNDAETQGTLKVLADVTVRNLTTRDIIELKRGTIVKQVDVAQMGEDPAIVAEVVDGSFAGAKVGLKNSAVEDTGGGTANKKLPIP